MSDFTVSTDSVAVASATHVGVKGPHLFRVFSCDAPQESSSRHSLESLDEVVIGRGERFEAERTRDTHGRRLTLTLADARVSSVHARVVRTPEGGFQLEDAGSKNGVIVNGMVQKVVELCDGDLIECGRTFFVFRRAVEGLAADADLRVDVGGELPVLSTVDAALRRSFEALHDIARSQVPVLIRGETGTGKELIARAVHAQSHAFGEFVAVNCGALSEHLVAAELFGARKGAFTGALQDRAGLIKAAEGGTLFLDEIGDLPLAAQPALLRVLQEREVLPVGGTKPQTVQFRVVAATHRNLEAMVARGDFRADLLARLSGFTVRLPPLSERAEDLGLLIGNLLRRRGGDARFSRAAVRTLLRYRWPMNIRELEQCLASALARSAEEVDVEHLPREVVERQPIVVPRADAAGLKAGVAPESRRLELVALLTQHRGNISAVSRAMAKDRVQIRRWIRSFGIAPEEYQN